jgi:hypothetical protein
VMGECPSIAVVFSQMTLKVQGEASYLSVWLLFLDREVGGRGSVELCGGRGLADFPWVASASS